MSRRKVNVNYNALTAGAPIRPSKLTTDFKVDSDLNSVDFYKLSFTFMSDVEECKFSEAVGEDVYLVDMSGSVYDSNTRKNHTYIKLYKLIDPYIKFDKYAIIYKYFDFDIAEYSTSRKTDLLEVLKNAESGILYPKRISATRPVGDVGESSFFVDTNNACKIANYCLERMDTKLERIGADLSSFKDGVQHLCGLEEFLDEKFIDKMRGLDETSP